MKFTRQEEIAVLLVSSLASDPGLYISLSDVGEEHNISPLFLKKIARLLKLANIVHSKEGVDGGYILAKDPKDIRVIDIFAAVSSEKSLNTGSVSDQGVRRCPIRPSCLPQRINVLIHEAFKEYLSDLTIDQFILKEKLV